MEKKNSSVCVVGLGYIGLPMASLLATKGYKVLGVDTDRRLIADLKKSKVDKVEPDLDIMVRSAINSGNLIFSAKVRSNNVFILAVPTPFKGKFEPDISFVEAATESIIEYLKPNDLVVVESTIPVGTTEKVAELIFAKRPALKDKVFVAHCPERVLPGQILKEMVDNDRIVGGINEMSSKSAYDFYRTIVNGEIFLSTAREAEMVKLVENSYRDVNIAFANEISMICEELGIDVWKTIQYANKHPRVKILEPGPGVGGHCIAVDPWFIVSSAPATARLIRTAREVNNSKEEWVLKLIAEKTKKLKNPVIACLGLAYKSDVEDLRESPAVKIVAGLTKEKRYKVLVVEPHIKKLPANMLKDAKVSLETLPAAVKKADVVVLLVAHSQFKKLDRKVFGKKILIDLKGVWRK